MKYNVMMRSATNNNPHVISFNLSKTEADFIALDMNIEARKNNESAVFYVVQATEDTKA